MSSQPKPPVPWDDIERPRNSFTVRLTKEHGVVKTYWGKDSYGDCLFIVELTGDYVHTIRSQKLKISGITVDMRTGLKSEEQLLVLVLNDRSNQDLFHSLCLTLIRSLAAASTSRAAVDIAVNHLKRWQRFLAGGRRNVLTLEQILGLFAELHVLRMLREKTGVAAISAWCGPEGSDQDFRLGHLLLEVKATKAAGASVNIASEFQLDSSGHPLYLMVVELSLSDPSQEAQSLNDLVAAMDCGLVNEPNYIEWMAKLTKAGYIQIDDYNAPLIDVLDVHVFKVTDGFPRIARSELSDAVHTVRYKLRITEVQQFAIPQKALWKQL